MVQNSPKFLFIFLILASCSFEETYVLRNVHRIGPLDFDIHQDTVVLVKKHKKSEKVISRLYTVNHKETRYLKYKYYKNGEIQIFPSKGIGEHLHGEALWYHPDNTLKVKVNYIEGKAEGSFLSYYPTHQPQCICYFENDKREGMQLFHWDNGQLSTKIEYHKGMPISILECYDRNGATIDCGTLKEGTGTWISYDDQNRVTEIEHYKDGKRTQRKKFKYPKP